MPSSHASESLYQFIKTNSFPLKSLYPFKSLQQCFFSYRSHTGQSLYQNPFFAFEVPLAMFCFPLKSLTCLSSHLFIDCFFTHTWQPAWSFLLELCSLCHLLKAACLVIQGHRFCSDILGNSPLPPDILLTCGLTIYNPAKTGIHLFY